MELFEDLHAWEGWQPGPARPKLPGNLAWASMFSGGGLFGLGFVLTVLWPESEVSLLITGLACLGAPLFGLASVIGWAIQSKRTKAATAWRNRCECARRFGSFKAADDVHARVLWLGEPVEALIESFGRPEAATPTATDQGDRHVYMYPPRGRGRKEFKVTVVDGVVVDWDGKDS